MKNSSLKKWYLASLIIGEIVIVILIGLLLYTKFIKPTDNEKNKGAYGNATEVVGTTAPDVTELPYIEDTPYVTTKDKPLVIDYELNRTGYMKATDIERQEIKQFTIMIYMNGSNLESDQSSAVDDIYEMIDSNYDASNLNILIFTGGTKTWHDFDIPSKTSCIYLLENKNLKKLADVGKQNMCEADTLSEFVDFGMELFPAQRSGLIMWNHGGGAVEGYGYDEYYKNDSLTLVELEDALKNSSASKRKLEFIGFDACLMANIETANAVQDYSKYLIASEEIEPGNGWDYSFLYDIAKSDDLIGSKIGEIIVNSYSEYYDKNLPNEETTLSVMDLGRVNATIVALNNFSKAVGSDIAQGKYKTIAKYRYGTKAFGTDADKDLNTDMIDLYNLAEKMSKDYTKESNAITNSIKKLVIYNKTSQYISNSNGVSIYFPYSNKNSVSRRIGIYSEIDFAPTYKQLVIDFSEQLTGKNFNEYNFEELTPVKVDNGEIELYLSNDQIDNVSEIYFTLWQQFKDEKDYYIKLARNSNVKIDDDGRISTSFDGVWNTINGQWVCMNEVETTSSYQKYSIPIILNGQNCDMIITYNKANPNGKILGCYSIDSETQMANKNMITIKNGDKIKFSYYAELFLSAEQLKNDSRPATKTFYSKEIIVDSQLEVKKTNVKDGVYLYGFEVFDTQNNQYFTESIRVDFN